MSEPTIYTYLAPRELAFLIGTNESCSRNARRFHVA